jgi:hypothetical protein
MGKGAKRLWIFQLISAPKPLLVENPLTQHRSTCIRCNRVWSRSKKGQEPSTALLLD